MATPPLPRGTPDDRIHRVANQLHSASIHLLRRARVVDREAGLTAERLSLLSVLSYAGPRTVSELADLELVSRPAISRTVGSLEEAGLARRKRVASDRRLVVVSATAKGRRLMEDARRRRLKVIAAELADLGAPALSALADAASVLDGLGTPRDPDA